jgi:hypothetical protein
LKILKKISGKAKKKETSFSEGFFSKAADPAAGKLI